MKKEEQDWFLHHKEVCRDFVKRSPATNAICSLKPGETGWPIDIVSPAFKRVVRVETRAGAGDTVSDNSMSRTIGTGTFWRPRIV